MGSLIIGERRNGFSKPGPEFSEIERSDSLFVQMLIVSFDDFLHQWVAHDVGFVQVK